jgi:hypothetical protein
MNPAIILLSITTNEYYVRNALTKVNSETQANKNFKVNLDHIGRLLKLMPVELNLSVNTLKKRFSREVKKIKKTSNTNTDAIQRAVSDMSTGIDDFIQLRGFLYSWMTVMLVTFIEAYMEENLELIAGKNPRLLRNLDPIPFEAILEVDSLEDLKIELRHQWARKTLRGGPGRWLKRLEEMGARGYEKDCCFRMKHLWDTRNLIVHAQGVVDKNYLKKYPKMKLKHGDRVRISENLLT